MLVVVAIVAVAVGAAEFANGKAVAVEFEAFGFLAVAGNFFLGRCVDVAFGFVSGLFQLGNVLLRHGLSLCGILGVLWLIFYLRFYYIFFVRTTFVHHFGSVVGRFFYYGVVMFGSILNVLMK